MKSILLALLLPLGTAAEPVVSMDSLLERPMDTRLREFSRLGEKAYGFLSRAAFDPANTLLERWRAVTTMGRMDPLRFRPELDKALASRDWFMRNAALIALQNDERSRAVAWSMRMLQDKALVVRTQAVRNLIDLNARESETLLWKEVSDKRNFRGRESLWIRMHIAEALGRFASPGRVRQFQKLLLDPDERLHKWAILGLESSTGLKLSSPQEPTEVRRQKWLSRLDTSSI